MLFLANFPGGLQNAREPLAAGLAGPELQTKPFLDALDQADDQELLDMLAAWKGGVPH
jgi:hypothetical protein